MPKLFDHFSRHHTDKASSSTKKIDASRIVKPMGGVGPIGNVQDRRRREARKIVRFHPMIMNARMEPVEVVT
jgi:hypothetical protein